MADLFGEWVLDGWIEAVFDACKKAPQHRYLFLSKNPKRYIEILSKTEVPDNFWFGTTATNPSTEFFWSDKHNTFLSIEPLLGDFTPEYEKAENKPVDWMIVGCETGNRKGKVIPKREWVEAIVNECRRTNTPVFMKDSLRDIWGEPLIREYPWN
jgi:protein gp37